MYRTLRKETYLSKAHSHSTTGISEITLKCKYSKFKIPIISGAYRPRHDVSKRGSARAKCLRIETIILLFYEWLWELIDVHQRQPAESQELLLSRSFEPLIQYRDFQEVRYISWKAYWSTEERKWMSFVVSRTVGRTWS